ncbi:hypothetical protein N431DRAFT_462185 [Stipitochalara longipes BDJ]|nr:hypothetical protein N431DRAFT_462185 [Stipitochalara longipes BDJ]
MATPLPMSSRPHRDLLDENISPSGDEKYHSKEKDGSHNIQITSDNDPNVINPGPSRSGTKPIHIFKSWFRSDSWQLEILSLFITLVCFAGLIIVLQQFDNKPLPNWRSGLTLNTVVSWISTVLKTALLLPIGSCISQLSWVWFNEQTRSLADICFFDAASRGPWGSLKLIFRLRGVYLACLGAFITIVALGMDPFFQQTIKYPSRLTGAPNSTAQVVFATSYNGQVRQATGGLELIEASLFLPTNLKGAIYSGLWASETLPPPSPLFSCSSGNCTWPLFSTLAANVKCDNISSKVALNCTDVPADGYSPETTKCNFVSPGDLSLNQTLNGSTEYDFFLSNTWPPANVESSWGYMGNYTGLISGFQWVKALSNFNYVYAGFDGPVLIGRDTTWEAQRCLFYFSVEQLRANVSAGVYSEEAVDEYFWDGIRTIDPTSLDPLSLVAPFAKDQIFNISGLAFESIVSEYNVALGPLGRVGSDSSAGFTASSDQIMRLWYGKNITKILENFNVYVTNSLRANQSALLQPSLQSGTYVIDSSTSINGTVWIPVPFVQVQWAWLAMPLGLYILVGLLLVLTMAESSRTGVGIWKSTPIAFLLHGIPDGEGQNMMQRTTEVSGKAMESAAEGVRVKLAADSDGVLRMLSG